MRWSEIEGERDDLSEAGIIHPVAPLTPAQSMKRASKQMAIDNKRQRLRQRLCRKLAAIQKKLGHLNVSEGTS